MGERFSPKIEGRSEKTPGTTSQIPVIKYKNPEDEPPHISYARNKEWSQSGDYKTPLSMPEEAEFKQWVAKSKINWRDTPNADYDMRGYWKAWKQGKVKQERSKFDGTLHFPDTWKTPYDAVFSRESMYAKPDAPHWVGDRLIDKNGRLIADETPK